MTYLSRMAGGGWPKLPWGLDAWLLAAPYLLLWPLTGGWVVLGYLGAVLGIRLGHGRGFQYSEPFKPGSYPEKIELIIPDSLPVKYQKMLIMLLTGLAVTLVMVVILSLHGFIVPGAILALSGALKMVAYFTKTTESSELLRGLFLGLGVYLVLLIT